MIALYPGSFDPVTLGHLDTAIRASRIFDTVIMAVFDRPNRKLLFSTEERVELLRAVASDYPGIKVTSYNLLTVTFAREVGAQVIVRGLRDPIDFELEFQMAQINQTLDPDIDMVVFMANRKFSFLSASIVREIAALDGDVSELVPAQVAQALKRKFKRAD
ncbi:MAG: pantetheine-phosphate adenylyltransferase [Chloroflexaceae bacterium]|nr:pantetheine-phosphate adenylyltransferase [Chloroflexaceae bacterium]NJO04735.1 pantetheine-phosphate adenylyltransferase [Chloroflexaceae bacterium]